MIGGITLVFLVISIAYAFLAKPIYQADIMVQVEDSPDTSATKSLLGDVSALFEIKSTAAAEAQILGSRLVVSRSVDKLHAYIDAKPRYFPIIGRRIAKGSAALSSPGLFGFGGFAWGNESIDVPVFDVPFKDETDLFQLVFLGDGRYRLSGDDLDSSVIGVIGKSQRFDGKHGKITLFVNKINANPKTSFNLIRYSRLATIADLQERLNIEEKIKQSGVVIATLQDPDPVYVSSMLGEIGKQYIKQNVDRKSEDAASSLTFLAGQLPQLKSQLEAAEERLTRLRDKRGTIDLDTEAKLILQEAADSKDKMLELMQKRDELSTRFMPTHPGMVALDSQIATLKAQDEEVAEKIKQLPDLQQDILRLMLDVKVDTDLYTALLNNTQQLQLVKAGKVGNVRLVDVPAVPEQPVKPKKSLVIAAATVLGFLFAAGAAFLKDMLFGGISSPAELEAHTGLNVYATIPFSDRQKEMSRLPRTRGSTAAVLADSWPGEPAVESLRSLRTALQFVMFDAKNNIVVLTGPTPGVGKSFVAANLATVLAAGGKRVLLVDADIRKGSLNQYFGLDRIHGLTGLISGSTTADQAIRKNVLENLDFLPTGVLPPNPSELLLNGRVEEILRDFASNYDIVLVDTSPVLVASDVSILAPLGGAIFLVARAGATKVGDISESVKQLAQNGAKVSGVLFNGVNSALGKYGFGSKYGTYRYAAYNYESGR